MAAKIIIASLLLWVGLAMAVRKQDPTEEVTFLPLSEEDEVTTVYGDSATMFDLGEESATVVAANSENPGSEITNLIEVRTKLKFIGNQVGLRNPELVPTLVSDIKEQQDQHEGSKFLFCLHVGTTAGESIKTKRAGFMEGRSQSLLDALHENDAELGVGAASAFDDTPFEHFKSTRFAGLVMKVYTGDVAPTCAKEDLVPPSA
jgi:hypothetical protein